MANHLRMGKSPTILTSNQPGMSQGAIAKAPGVFYGTAFHHLEAESPNHTRAAIDSNLL